MSSKFTREQIIERIRSLMALGNQDSNTFAYEAIAAIRKAGELMQQYNVELADILAVDGDVLDGIIHKDINMADKANKYLVRGWRIALFQALCKINMCKSLFYASKPVLIVVGRPLHVDVVEQAYYSLSNQIEDLATREAAKAAARGEIRANWPSPRNTRTWKTSFMIGATETIAQRIIYEWELSKEQQQSNLRALVLYSDKRITDYVHEVIKPVNTTTNYGPSKYNVDAFFSGKEAGVNIHHRKGIYD